MSKKKKTPPRKQPSTLLILTELVLLLIAIFAFKDGGETPVSARSLEEQLDQALEEGRPAFVFLHSLNCVPCKEMMQVVEQVYPEFQASVVLIDVDVYDQENANLLNRERLQAIPTLIFYDTQGARQVVLGVLSPDQFRATLQTLAGD